MNAKVCRKIAFGQAAECYRPAACAPYHARLDLALMSLQEFERGLAGEGRTAEMRIIQNGPASHQFASGSEAEFADTHHA